MIVKALSKTRNVQPCAAVFLEGYTLRIAESAHVSSFVPLYQSVMVRLFGEPLRFHSLIRRNVFLL